MNIKKMLILFGLSGALTKCSHNDFAKQDDICKILDYDCNKYSFNRDTTFLEYINYVDSLPLFINTFKSTPNHLNSFEIKSITKKELIKIPKKTYDDLLSQNIITEWELNSNKILFTKEEINAYLKNTNKGINIYYWTELAYNMNYNTCLLVVEYNYNSDLEHKKIILLNYKNNRILSIGILAEYFETGFSNLSIFSKGLNDNIFIIFKNTEATDIYNESDKKSVDFNKFVINNEGCFENVD